jgi:exopolysaccharide biosynthesis polyprenyl glycosylphosphotransferase
MESTNATSPPPAAPLPALLRAQPAGAASGGALSIAPPRTAPRVDASGERIVPLPRWPRQHLLSGALSVALVTALALPAALDASHRSWVVFVAATLACVGRLLFAAPARRPVGDGVRAWVAGAAFSATAVIAIGWWLAQLAEHKLGLDAIATSWAATTLVLVAGPALRRAEVVCRTGTRLFVLGSDAQAAELRHEASLRGDFEVVGQRDPAAPLMGDRLLAELHGAQATVMVLSEQGLRSPEIVRLAIRANLAGVRVRDLRSFYERELGKVAASELSLAWFLFDIAAIHRRRLYGTTKRAMEGLVAAVILLAAAPLLPLIALAIKLASPGPVLFRQPRVGIDGRVFTLAKFRSMHTRPGGEHGEWADAADDRVFGVGRLLRRLRLDELPQLVSVLRGELSLVGPRPEQPSIVERMERELPFYAARHTVRPGVTGWAQVNLGYAGSDAGTLAKLQYDLFYIKHQSLLLDLRIMATTARAILLGSGS